MIRVCVCVSGIPRSGLANRDLRRNYEIFKKVFYNADFYFATWKGNERAIQKYFYDQEVKYFDEPMLDYHPFIDIEKETTISDNEKLKKAINKAKKEVLYRETSRHQTKQILGHCYLIDSIEKEYDIVIRCRYDTLVYHKANFSEYINLSFIKNVALGFATLEINSTFSKTETMTVDGMYHNCFLFDQLIIHPRKILDTTYVYTLHNQQKLIAAEHGWWQVLSGNNQHVCVNGWANPDKSVSGEFL